MSQICVRLLIASCSSRRIHDNSTWGASVWKAGSRLDRCELWGNVEGGVCVGGGGFKNKTTLSACTFRDHSGGAVGILVRGGEAGMAMMDTDCVFARNSGGDIVRKE